MRILVIMDPGIPIPPPLYGGHERLVDMFVKDYVNQGYEMSLLSGPDSKPLGKTFNLASINLDKTRATNIIQYLKTICRGNPPFKLPEDILTSKLKSGQMLRIDFKGSDPGL